MPKHIADAEMDFVVVNVNPDFCEVDEKVVPFEISQELSSEKTQYSPNVYSRGQRVLPEGAIVEGVVGNAGKGVLSTVSEGQGHSITIEGSDRLKVNGRRTCHHGHQVKMNVKA
jgi:hypothetical protein